MWSDRIGPWPPAIGRQPGLRAGFLRVSRGLSSGRPLLSAQRNITERSTARAPAAPAGPAPAGADTVAPRFLLLFLPPDPSLLRTTSTADYHSSPTVDQFRAPESHRDVGVVRAESSALVAAQSHVYACVPLGDGSGTALIKVDSVKPKPRPIGAWRCLLDRD